MLKKIMLGLMAPMALMAAAAFAAVDVNSANQAELEAVTGIGPSLAGRMLDARKSGSFKNWPDLIERVKGIGAGSAARLSDAGLTVGGASFNGAPRADKASLPATAAASQPAKR